MPVLNGTVFRTDCKDRLDGRGCTSSVWRRIQDLGLCLRSDRANTLSSKFRLLFLIITANNLADYKVKEDERFSISISVFASRGFFNFLHSYFFSSLQRALSLFQISPYNLLFLGVNSKMKQN
jgi:hypothetical protein